MGGVYIKGMEMPKHCADCEWLQQRFPGGKDWCKRTGELVHESWESATTNPIPESCPLVHVPPHGDLIDKNETIKALWKALYEYEDMTEKQFVESSELDVSDWILHRIFVQNMSDIDRKTILQMTTIIEAEWREP